MVLPLKLEVEVFSGIAPPQQLLDAMAEAEEAKINLRRVSTAGSTGSARRQKASAVGLSSTKQGPSGAGGASSGSTQPGTNPPPAAHPPNYADAPPSYEDAIGSQLPPLDGSRPQYMPPSAGEDDLLQGDEKARLKRRDS